MLSREVIAKIRRIHITTTKVVSEAFAGQYQSAFKGRGLEFEEVREYIPGDDVRHIDWNVSARMGKPYIKLHKEERELTVVIAVDVSPSMNTGSYAHLKRETAAEVAAVLAFSAIVNNDKVSLFLFSDKVEMFVPPRKGQNHLWKVIREILTATSSGKRTDLSLLLDESVNYLRKKGALMFLLSDFEELTGNETDKRSRLERSLKVASKKYDLIPVVIKDRFERELPDAGLIAFTDPETGEQIWVDSSNPIFRNNYRKVFDENMRNIHRLFSSLNLDYTLLWNGEDYIKSLVKLFRIRERKKWR